MCSSAATALLHREHFQLLILLARCGRNSLPLTHGKAHHCRLCCSDSVCCNVGGRGICSLSMLEPRKHQGIYWALVSTGITPHLITSFTGGSGGIQQGSQVPSCSSHTAGACTQLPSECQFLTPQIANPLAQAGCVCTPHIVTLPCLFCTSFQQCQMMCSLYTRYSHTMCMCNLGTSCSVLHYTIHSQTRTGPLALAGLLRIYICS